MNIPRRTALGERGEAVKQWQTFLNTKGFNAGKADGIHGKGTEAASIAYESSIKKDSGSKTIVYNIDQKRAIDSVLSIFETGRVPSLDSYSTCTVLKDGAGISYGKHQCTDKSNSLDSVCKRYISLNGQYSTDLSKYMSYITANESAEVNPSGPYPEWLKDLISILKKAGSDPLMQRAQDEIFDELYFTPAVKHADNYGLTKALSLLVMYDTCIHSGPGRVKSHADKITVLSPNNGGDESEWIKQYIQIRRAWLAASSNTLVQKCVYRPDALSKIINEGNWDLILPMVVLGRTIS